MTIEDVKEELISILTEIEITGGSMVTSAYTDELKMAIETMRKYQRIVDIVSLNDEEFKQCGLKELKEILEVIADGKTEESEEERNEQ